MIRSIVFWAHLSAGIAAGLVILIMSVTGVLLTYERQIVAFADRAVNREAAAAASAAPSSTDNDSVQQPLEALLAAVEAERPNFAASGISVPRDTSDPVAVRAGRAGTLYVDRQSGRILGEGATGVRAFFRKVEDWHRWLGVDGERRGIARAATGASNLVFLCLVLTGFYLWFPRVARWAAFKARLLFIRKARSGKARDFNWHHVIGFWSAIPLAVIVASSVVFSYSWANSLVFAAFGESAPVRGGRNAARAEAPAAARGSAPAAARAGGVGRALAAELDGAAAAPAVREATSARLTLDELLERAGETAADWRTMTIDLGRSEPTVAIDIDRGNGGQPHLRSRLTLDAATGAVLNDAPFSSQSPGRRARSMIRFLHTGEALGIVGQTIAGVVTAASLVMIWTGWALAYRRLVRPLLTRRRKVT